MKNQTLAYHLLPTDDASHLFIGLKSGNLIYSQSLIEHRGDEKNTNHHLYLTSDAPIKEGYWFINMDFKNEYKVLKLTKGELPSEANNCFKIEFTTDPKLIANGVPVIDGNTKAWMVSHILEGSVKPEVLKEVNFLTEFCKRWNENEEDDFMKDFPLSIDEKIIEILKKEKAQMFSLEDMRKCFFEGFSYDNFGVPDNRDKYFNDFIQSLTKETPKGDIAIELNDGNIYFK